MDWSKLTVPIIQGGMGIGVSMARLAGSVASHGGMGVISSVNAGYQKVNFQKDPRRANVCALREEIQEAKRIANGKGIIAVNIMTATSFYEETCRAAIEAGADAIISGAGLPLTLAELVGDSKVGFAPIVSSGKAASLLCRQYSKKQNKIPDFLIIEGHQAGGHLGFTKEELRTKSAKTNEEILLECQNAIAPYEEEYQKKIPIFVAGGVYTREDILHYQKLGASGVQMATRFIVTEECDASEGFKQAVIQAKREDIQIVESPVGMPARAIVSPLIKRMERGEKFKANYCNNCLKTCKKGEKTPYCISRALVEAVQGNWEDGLFFCGENAWRVDHKQTVKELIEELTAEKS